MLTYRAADTGDVTVLDFFSDAPALRQENLDFYHLDLSYGPTTQRFYIGAGSAAVPGMIPGLFTALEKWDPGR